MTAATQQPTPSPSANAPVRRPFRRLHASTYVALLVTATVLFFANVPGQYAIHAGLDPIDPETPFNQMVFERFEHGWPCAFLVRSTSHVTYSSRETSMAVLCGIWPFSEGFVSFDVWSFFCDVLAAIGTLLFAAFLAEYWRRQRQSVWQLRVSDLFGLTAIVGLGSCYALITVRDYEREVTAMRELGFLATEAPISDPYLSFTWQTTRGGPTWLRTLIGDKRFPRVFDRLVYAHHPKGDLDKLQAFKHLKAVSLMGERPAEAFTSLSKIKTLEAIDAGILNQELKWESPPDRMPDPGPNDQVDRQLANSLPALAQLPKLRIFRATGMEIGLRAIKAIVQFPRLEVLSLSQSRITNEGLASLGECKTLRELDIDETGVNDSGLKHLRLIPNLQILDLRGCPLTDAACEPLGTLATLRSLNLNETGIRGSGLQALASLPELETLSLPFGVDRAAAADLQHRLPSLKIKIGDENFAGDEQ